MANDPKRFDFTASIGRLEETNTWFQNEDLNLDEGLEKLKEGKELIKKCRTRLQEVENKFVKIKKEFAGEDEVRETVSGNGTKSRLADASDISPDDVPF